MEVLGDATADIPLTDVEFECGRKAFLPTKARLATGMTKAEFSNTFTILLDKICAWEKGIEEPSIVERAYLSLIRRHPQQLIDMLSK
tara:strand:+ start:229 stop:489 length:261 start_codon:yes stop_codon:yes gene_type:complete